MASRLARTRFCRKKCDSSSASRVRRKAALAVALCSVLGLSAARAQNLLSNTSFDTDIAGWTSNFSAGISLTWNTLDSKASSKSGSLRMTDITSVDNGGFDLFGVCVPVTAGETYHESASFYFQAGQTQKGSFKLSVLFYSGIDCSGASFGQVQSPALNPADNTWQRLDTQSFVAPVGATHAVALFGFRKIGNGGTIVGNMDEVVFEPVGFNLCFASDDQLCLGSRFKVIAHWVSDTDSGDGHAVALVSDTGSFWFFAPTNLEMLVKVLDACTTSGKKWVFGGGLTNVNVVITITDLKTSLQKIYTNPPNTAFLPIQDTSAFGVCP